MNMRKYTNEYRLEHWAEVMREREESGLGIRAYCAREGFHENRYFYWQKKLRELASEELAGIGTSSKELTPVFAKVNLSAPSTLPASTVIYQNHISIETVGVRISANSGYPVEKLAELLKTVMRSCC